MRLIIATSNHNKLKEIRHILRGVQFEMVCLADLDRKFRLVENGKTFFENAVKKTAPVSKAYPEDIVVGEDSGLEIKYLKGEPGVKSKRYAGPNASDAKIINKVLTLLEDVSAAKRSAQFHCCMVVMKSGKVIKKFDGTLKGRIHIEPIGTNGFGYDPILYLPKFKKTVAQLTPAQKNVISHRAQAFGKLRIYLKSL